jgi:hypothetical protein
MAAYMSVEKLVELVRRADAQKAMFVRVLGGNRLGLGTDPLQPTHVIDLSTETIDPYRSSDLDGVFATTQATASAAAPKIGRRTGEYWVEIHGKRTECNSLKELLSAGLQSLEELKPGTLERLLHIKLRSRRIVARDPNQLFDKTHLSKKYAEQLMPGWWYGTNNSATETNAWLERAASCAELVIGESFKTNMTITIDQL